MGFESFSNEPVKNNEAELNSKAEEAMTPEQAELSLQKEEGYGKLSPEQQELLDKCDLNVKQRTSMGIIGFQRIIKGTIGGSKVEIIFDPEHDWMGSAEAKIDGEDVPEEDARALRKKYQAIAEFQTKENSAVGQYKRNKEFIDYKAEEEAKKGQKLSLAEKIKDFLW